MSGALGALAGNALALTGSVLGQAGISVGGVRLYGFEVPDTVPWGTKQLIKEHVYPGGLNILQALGPARKPIEWSGKMIGPDATFRAETLDQLAAAGDEIQVSWGSLNFHGVIEEFYASYKHEWQGDYRIVIRVLWDYSHPPAVIDPVAAVLSDLQQAASLVSTISGVATAVTSVTNVQQGATSTGTLQATAGQINAAQSAIGTAAAASGSMLATGVPGPTTIAALAAAAGTTANSVAAFAYASRAANNWQQVPGISTPGAAPQQSLPDLSQYPGA